MAGDLEVHQTHATGPGRVEVAPGVQAEPSQIDQGWRIDAIVGLRHQQPGRPATRAGAEPVAFDDHDRGEAASHACRRGGQPEHATADNQHLWIAVQWLGDARQQPAAFVIGQLVGPDGMADSHRIQRRRRRDRAASATS